MAPLVEDSTARKVMIDHHLEPGDFASICISHPEISSTCELIFRLICRMGYFSEMSYNSAMCICAGMLTDTGGLAFNANSPEVYIIMSELLSKGIDKDELYRRLFNTHKEARMRLMGRFLENMEVITPWHTAITTLSQSELSKHQYEPGDTEGFVNLPLSIEGVFFSVFLRQSGDTIKLSFRSQGEFPCNTFAADLFGGGGHKNAAGGESNDSLEVTKQRIIEALPHYQREFEANAQLGF